MPVSIDFVIAGSASVHATSPGCLERVVDVWGVCRSPP